MTSRPPPCVVLDSSAVIALSSVGLLEKVARLFDRVVVPRAVYEEAVVRGAGRPGSRELRGLVESGRVELLAPKDRWLVEALHDPLGLGEAEAITLALEQGCVVVLDDRVARLKARAMGLPLMGTLRLLRMAYDAGLLSLDELVNALEDLRRHGFRVTDDIIKRILEELGGGHVEK